MKPLRLKINGVGDYTIYFEDKCEGDAILEILNADSILQKTEEPDEEQVLIYEYFDKRKSVPVIEVQDHLNYVLNPRGEKIHFANLRKGYQAPVCTHSWKPYMGFTENYNYCEHCGVKEHES